MVGEFDVPGICGDEAGEPRSAIVDNQKNLGIA